MEGGVITEIFISALFWTEWRLENFADWICLKEESFTFLSLCLFQRLLSLALKIILIFSFGLK